MNMCAAPAARYKLVGAGIGPTPLIYVRRDSRALVEGYALIPASPFNLATSRNCTCNWTQRPFKRQLDVRAQAGKTAGTRERLPIFPLGMVALPAAHCPLHIFEARYRVLFSTLLAGEGGIDDGLVSEDKPWKGSRRFGMAFFDSQAGGLAAVGTVLEVQEHSLLEDGRLLLQNIGRERFKIVDVVEERPVLVCDVEYLDEDEGDNEEVKDLSGEVAQLFKDVVRLSAKLKDVAVEEAVADPPQLSTLGPREMSFYIASLFAGNPYNQQALLEEEDTKKRLLVEQDLLSGTLKYLSAQVALQSAFGGESGGSGSSNEDVPSP